jgi:hypothetical protein
MKATQDLSFTINIMPYYIYKELHHNCDDSDLQPIDNPIMLSNRTLQDLYGILPILIF